MTRTGPDLTGTYLDTKPANILIEGVGTDHPIVKVADLGLSKSHPAYSF
jgi:serine/threonine protein kinase